MTLTIFNYCFWSFIIGFFFSLILERLFDIRSYISSYIRYKIFKQKRIILYKEYYLQYSNERFVTKDLRVATSFDDTIIILYDNNLTNNKEITWRYLN